MFLKILFLVEYFGRFGWWVNGDMWLQVVVAHGFCG